jgi:hypothetical protein
MEKSLVKKITCFGPSTSSKISVEDGAEEIDLSPNGFFRSGLCSRETVSV